MKFFKGQKVIVCFPFDSNYYKRYKGYTKFNKKRGTIIFIENGEDYPYEVKFSDGAVEIFMENELIPFYYNQFEEAARILSGVEK